MPNRPCLSILLLVAPVLMLLGCGSSDGKVNVSGEVKFAGKSVKQGAITFTPIDGKTSTEGGVITDGNYKARVPQGKSRVAIVGSRVTGKKKLYDSPNSPEQDITEQYLPDKYNTKTELEADLQTNKTLDFDLAP